MAITQIGVKPKEKTSTWDQISKVLGFVSTAANVAESADKLLSSAPLPEPEVVTDPTDGIKTPEMVAAKTDGELNPMKRRLFERY